MLGRAQCFGRTGLLPHTASICKHAGAHCFGACCRQGRLTVKELFMGLSQAAAGLHAVHVKGIVHQDVRLDNILCNEDDTVWKIGDFGSSARNRVDGKPNIIAAQECQ